MPLLNYTIEFLASSGIKDIVILVKSHASQIEDYIKNVKGELGVKITCHRSLDSLNFGDAIRDVAKQIMFHNDFVLVYGDIVSNQPLKTMFSEHMQRRKLDSNAVMTVFLTQQNKDPDLLETQTPILEYLSNAPKVERIKPRVSEEFNTQSSMYSPNFTTKEDTSSISQHIDIPKQHKPLNSVGENLSISSCYSSYSSYSPHNVSSFDTHSSSQTFETTRSPPSTSIGAGLFSANNSLQSIKKDYLTAISLTSNDCRYVLLQEDTGHILTYEEKIAIYQQPRDIPFNSVEHGPVICRTDLQESGIAICAPEVLNFFKDQYDNSTLAQLIRELTLNDIHDLKVYAYIGDEQYYTSRVSNLRRYYRVSTDILKRRIYPLVPEKNLSRTSSWRFFRHCIYKENDVIIHGKCIVSPNSAIGAKTTVDEASEIIRSIIGRNCTIGKRVKIKNSIVWDNVNIEDDCTITNAIICSGVIIRSGVIVFPGCILSFNTVISSGTNLPSLTKLTTFGLNFPPLTHDTNSQISFDNESEDVFNDILFSNNTNNYNDTSIYNTLCESKLIVDFDIPGCISKKWNSPPLPFNELYTGWETLSHIRHISTLSTRMLETNIKGEDETRYTNLTTRAQLFSIMKDLLLNYREIIFNSTLLDNLFREINGIKFSFGSFGIDDQSCAEALLIGVFELVSLPPTLTSIHNILLHYKIALLEYFEVVESRLNLLFSLESYFEKPGNSFFFENNWIPSIFNMLYELEIFDEEVFLEWSQEYTNNQEEESQCYTAAISFIEFLKKEEE